jgi:hypothetical protein
MAKERLACLRSALRSWRENPDPKWPLRILTTGGPNEVDAIRAELRALGATAEELAAIRIDCQEWMVTVRRYPGYD